MTRRVVLAVISALVVALGMPTGTAGAATPGTIALDVSVPDGATALIEVDRVDGKATAHVVVVHDSTEAPVERITVAAGTYKVTARALSLDGARYVAAASPRQVRVVSGQTKEVGVTYRSSLGVQNLVPTRLTTTTVALDWDAALGDDTVVWRVPGSVPTEKPGKGTKVVLNGSSFRDTGLTPGTTYSYSIFARPGDGAFGNVDGDPVTFTVGTLTDGTSTVPSFITAPGTAILTAAQLASVRKLDGGLMVTLADGVPTPLPGHAVTLPVTPVLEGGYLGEVVDVSTDGRTVLLTQASLSQAFDFYHLSVSDFDATPAVAAAPATSQPVPSGKEKAAAKRAARDGAKTAAPTSLAAAKAAAPAAAPAPLAAAASKVECAGLSGGSVTPHFSTSSAGHADVTVDKYKIWFVEVPSGVGVDFGYSLTAKGAVDVHRETGVTCGFPLPKFAKQLTAYPVPIAVMAEPIGEVGLTGGMTVNNVGMTATAGFEASGHMGFKGGNYANGSPILKTAPTEPKGSGEATLSLKLGGAINFGPGVGTSEVGIIAGLGGEVSIIDASLTGMVTTDDEACLKLEAQSGFGIYLVARAWVAGYNWEYRLEVDALQKTYPWGGSPWFWPNDCEESDTPTDDVTGPGVTPVGDDLTGSDEQWGKVDGFVPGEKTWVLSTGRVADAVGPPAFFASTSMGRPGLQSLSDLVGGLTTYDGAQFSVTVIPNEHTLHVRYAFASEEYPEYVGSEYNDVMAVFVGGKNCAYVPGTNDPVSINSVNDHTNAQYYVDNSVGAAGYGTTMDGLTTPLTCSVPVTPGEPVTVSIAVADASDSSYDSAIALLDGGIWSD